MKRILFAIVVLWSAGALAQAEYPLKIVDKETLQPISGAEVFNSAGVRVAVTSKTGLFTLKPSQGKRFQIVHQSYFVYTLEIDWGSSKTTPVLRTIPMSQNGFELLEATVTGQRVKVTDTTFLQDFELMGEYFLLLGYDYLVLTDSSFLPLKKIKNHKDFQRIEKDPRGYVFLFTEDSVHQVFLGSQKLYFYPPFHIATYQTYIEPLHLAVNGALIMRNMHHRVNRLPVSEFRAGNQGKAIAVPPFHNKGIQYLLYQKDKNPEVIFTSIDTPAVRIAEDAFRDYFGMAAAFEIMYDQQNIYDSDMLFKIDVARKTYQNFYGDFLPFPILRRADTILIFDHIYNVVHFYNLKLEKIKTAAFELGKKVVAPTLVQDEISESIFVVEKHNGMVKLIALKGLEQQAAISLNLFAKEIKVRNSIAYYLNEYDKLEQRQL